MDASNRSRWISARQRKRPSRVPDLRRTIAYRAEFKLKQKFIAIVGDDGTGRNTLVRRFLDISGGPFQRPEIRKRTPRSVLVDLKKMPNFKEEYMLNLLVFIFNCQQLNTRNFNEALSQLKSTAVVFDVANENTFHIAINCMLKISGSLGTNAPKYILVGNKIDLQEHQVTLERGERVADTCGAQHYYECSAKMNTQVDAVLDAILNMAYSRPL